MTVQDVIEYRDIHRFHSDFYRRNRPVVLRGLPQAYPISIFSWSAESIARAMGEKRVPVYRTTTGFLSYERDSDELPFSEFVARSFGADKREGVRYYYKNSTQLLPAGLDDAERIRELAPYMQRAKMRNLWISGPGLTVGLHFDPADNLNFQLRGRKTFDLYPPGTRGYYTEPMFSQTAHISGVFRHGPELDRARFPLFDPARRVRFELEAGDALYLPAYWWHQVQSHAEENLNLNFWWLPPFDKQLRNPNQALRGYAQLAMRFARFGNIVQAPAAAKG